jgi:hypothetical protein
MSQPPAPLREIDAKAWAAQVDAAIGLFLSGQKYSSDATARSLLAQKQAECERLRTDLDGAKATLKASEERIGRRDAELARTTLALAEARANGSDGKASADLRDINAELRERIKQHENELLALRTALQTARGDLSAAGARDLAAQSEVQLRLQAARKEGADGERTNFAVLARDLTNELANALVTAKSETLAKGKLEAELAALHAQMARRAPAVIGREAEDEVEGYLREVFGQFLEIENVSKLPHQLDLKLTTRTTPPVSIRIDSKNYCADGRIKPGEMQTFLANVDGLQPPAHAAILFTTTPVPGNALIAHNRRNRTHVFHVGRWQRDQLVYVIHQAVSATLLEHEIAGKPAETDAAVSKFIEEMLKLIERFSSGAELLLEAARRNQGVRGEHWRLVLELARTAHTSKPGIITHAHVEQLENGVPTRQTGGRFSVEKDDQKTPATRAPKRKRSRGALASEAVEAVGPTRPAPDSVSRSAPPAATPAL